VSAGAEEEERWGGVWGAVEARVKGGEAVNRVKPWELVDAAELSIG